MSDRHTKEQRSRNMARIRKFGNRSTEMCLVKLFRLAAIKGWRRHLKLPGRPDFTFRRQRVVVFADGCYWHACPACNWTPVSNREYWLKKLAGNAEKDRDADRQLQERGWLVIRVWEHDIKRQPSEVIERIRRALAARDEAEQREGGKE